MQGILAPLSLFPLEEADLSSSDCELQALDKFDKQLIQLRGAGNKTSPPLSPPPTTALPVYASDKAPSRSCLPDIVIDCTCMDPKPKPTRLYYCCCINLRCSVSACRCMLFVIAFGLLCAGVAAAAVVTIWGIVVGRIDARNYGLVGFSGGILALVYACCVASHCQASRKTRELRELALTAAAAAQKGKPQQQLLPSQAQDRQRPLQNSRISSGNYLGAASQASLQGEREEQQQQQPPTPVQNQQQKQKLRQQTSTGSIRSAGSGSKIGTAKKLTQQNSSKKSSGGDSVRLPPSPLPPPPPPSSSEPVIFDLGKY